LQIVYAKRSRQEAHQELIKAVKLMITVNIYINLY